MTEVATEFVLAVEGEVESEDDHPSRRHAKDCSCEACDRRRPGLIISRCAHCSWTSGATPITREDARSRFRQHRTEAHPDLVSPSAARGRRPATAPERVAEIVELARAGRAGNSIAVEFDMPTSTVARIIRAARAEGRL